MDQSLPTLITLASKYFAAIDMLALNGMTDDPFFIDDRPIVFSVQQAEVMIADFAVMTHSEEPVPTQLVSDHSGASYGTT